MSEEEANGGGEENDYNYLMSMSIWSMTNDDRDKLLATRDKKVSKVELTPLKD